MITAITLLTKLPEAYGRIGRCCALFSRQQSGDTLRAQFVAAHQPLSLERLARIKNMLGADE
jgi:hypothetical protein